MCILILRVDVAEMLVLHHHCMHVENELAEIVTTGDHEFKEIVEEYEEEFLCRRRSQSHH